MEFINPKVAAAYEPGVPDDITINRSDYHGKLSAIDEKVAKAMADAGSHYVKVKAPKAAKPEAQKP